MTLTLRSVGQRLLLIPCAAALVTIGCGEGQILQSPTGPSGSLGSTTFLTGDAAVDASTASSTDEFGSLAKGGNGKGNGNGGGNDKGNRGGGGKGPDADADSPGTGGGPGRSHEARVVGFVSATGVDSIIVNDILVTAGPDTVIRHGNRYFEMAEIAVGDHVVVRGAMETDATGTKLVAIEIKVQEQGEDDEDDGTTPPAAPLKGTISGLTPSATGCTPTFTIGTTAVTTTATTTYDDVTCATLANGNLVEVTGATRADGMFIATKVELQSGPNEVKGVVSELTGTLSCSTATPALTFKVGPALTATTVKTTATTTFTGAAGFSCATLAIGANVEVEGTTQADGSITAASVELH